MSVPNNGMEFVRFAHRTASPLRGCAATHAGRYVIQRILNAPDRLNTGHGRKP